MINIEYPDKNFNLNELTDKELFDGLKDGMVKAIRTIKGFENVKIENIKFLEDYCSRRKAYGKDGYIYPNIVLSVAIIKINLSPDIVNFFIDPYSIKIAEHKYGAPAVENENLTKSFVDFMKKRFPNNQYEQARKKYLEKEKIIKTIEERLL